MHSSLSSPSAPSGAPRRALGAVALLLSLCAAAVFCAPARATGVVPETPVVIVEEADGEASMNVRNTEATPVLLHTAIVNLPEDDEPLVVAVPTIIRVEANQTQSVRFILQKKTPLKVERLKRVTFEGIPPKARDGSNTVSVNVRQNLPLLIRPKSLPANREPWKLLRWSLSDGRLQVRNDSPYVVRLAQAVQLLPGSEKAELEKPYLLPGSQASVPLPESAAHPNAVRISPATAYGFGVDAYDAPVDAGAAN